MRAIQLPRFSSSMTYRTPEIHARSDRCRCLITHSDSQRSPGGWQSHLVRAEWGSILSAIPRRQSWPRKGQGRFWGFAGSGNYLYGAADIVGLEVFDVTNLQNP